MEKKQFKKNIREGTDKLLAEFDSKLKSNTLYSSVFDSVEDNRVAQMHGSRGGNSGGNIRNGGSQGRGNKVRDDENEMSLLDYSKNKNRKKQGLKPRRGAQFGTGNSGKFDDLPESTQDLLNSPKDSDEEGGRSKSK